MGRTLTAPTLSCPPLRIPHDLLTLPKAVTPLDDATVEGAVLPAQPLDALESTHHAEIPVRTSLARVPRPPLRRIGHAVSTPPKPPRSPLSP